MVSESRPTVLDERSIVEKVPWELIQRYIQLRLERKSCAGCRDEVKKEALIVQGESRLNAGRSVRVYVSSAIFMNGLKRAN